jgi:hypothetical protein
MVGIGALTGLLHWVGSGDAGLHVAVTAALDALVAVFAPAAFIPAVLGGEERHGAPAPVLAARLAVLVAFGWLVAGSHLLVWALTAALVPRVGAPGGGALPFTVVGVGVAAAATALVYAWPRRGDLARRAAVGVLVVLYVAAFWSHAVLLRPSLAAVRHRAAGYPLPVAIGFGALALLSVWALMRHTLTPRLASPAERATV